MAEHVRTPAHHMYGNAPHLRQQAAMATTRHRLFSTAHTALPCVLLWQNVILHAIYLHKRGEESRTWAMLYLYRTGYYRVQQQQFLQQYEPYTSRRCSRSHAIRQNPYIMHAPNGNRSSTTRGFAFAFYDPT